jgi:pimeloyl-ACP methyl ester carboxylesterase
MFGRPDSLAGGEPAPPVRGGSGPRMPTRLSWTISGSGASLLLVPGLGTTRGDFAGLRRLLEPAYQVLVVDLPGTGASPALRRRPTVAALTDVIEADLDLIGIRDVHALGVSLGARIVLELARRDRVRSAVAIAPSGMNLPAERLYQGLALGGTRVLMRPLRPLFSVLSRSPAGRGVVLGGLRALPWLATEEEARAAVAGFAESVDFWRLLWWAILADLPTGLDRVRCPVTLAQGTADLLAAGQTPRYLFVVPGARFLPLPGGGHSPVSDTPATILELVNETVHRARSRSRGARPPLLHPVK